MLCIIVVMAFFKGKFLEISITMLLFYTYRRLFEVQYHASSLYICGFISVVVFKILIYFNQSLSVSLFCSTILTFVLTTISYLIKMYIENTILVKIYRQKIKKFKIKALENLTLGEMFDMFPDIKYYNIIIVYNYIHRSIGTSSIEVADRFNISEQTIYKYLKEIKFAYKDLNKQV